MHIWGGGSTEISRPRSASLLVTVFIRSFLLLHMEMDLVTAAEKLTLCIHNIPMGDGANAPYVQRGT